MGDMGCKKTFGKEKSLAANSLQTPAAELLDGHEQALFAQGQQAAVCNANHVVESRLATWLLRQPTCMTAMNCP